MIDVRRSPELQAAILACKRVDAPLRRAIYAASRQSINSLWQPSLEKRASSRMAQRVVVKGARAAVRVDGFTLHAATSRRALRGGLVPSEDYAGVEFGARTRKATHQQRSRLGKSYSVTRTVNRQFPGRQKAGRIAFDAASEVTTKTVRAWVVAVVDTIVNATRGEASS